LKFHEPLIAAERGVRVEEKTAADKTQRKKENPVASHTVGRRVRIKKRCTKENGESSRCSRAAERPQERKKVRKVRVMTRN